MSRGLTSVLLDHYRVAEPILLPETPRPSFLRLLSNSSESLLCSGTLQAPRLLSGQPCGQRSTRGAWLHCLPWGSQRTVRASAVTYLLRPRPSSPQGFHICIFQQSQEPEAWASPGSLLGTQIPRPLSGFLNTSPCYHDPGDACTC